MSIETISDVSNPFLSRRELTCNFAGRGGKLKKLEAVDIVSKEFKLNGKIVIPVNLKNHVGKPLVTGTFYVYEDEKLAKEHVNPTIFKRLDKVMAAQQEAQQKEAESAQEKAAKTAPEEKDAEEKKEEKAE